MFISIFLLSFNFFFRRTGYRCAVPSGSVRAWCSRVGFGDHDPRPEPLCCHLLDWNQRPVPELGLLTKALQRPFYSSILKASRVSLSGGVFLLAILPLSFHSEENKIPTVLVSEYSVIMGSTEIQSSVLAIIEQGVLPADAIAPMFTASRQLLSEEFRHIDPEVITGASSLSQLPKDASFVNVVIFICSSLEFPGNQLLEESLRVMKPGGTILVCMTSQSAAGQLDKALSSLERKLLLTGFSEAQSFQADSEVFLSCGVKAKKASWNIGSSFSIKKIPKTLPNVQIDDDMDLIDEDTLLTEEDLKKPQLPTVGDCEVRSTRKACRNCTCGRAEAEEKVVKLGPTDEQLNNPQSACGSCGLGDAFRCSTCPYKGLPPFKLGEKVSIPNDFLTADI